MEDYILKSSNFWTKSSILKCYTILETSECQLLENLPNFGVKSGDFGQYPRNREKTAKIEGSENPEPKNWIIETFEDLFTKTQSKIISKHFTRLICDCPRLSTENSPSNWWLFPHIFHLNHWVSPDISPLNRWLSTDISPLNWWVSPDITYAPEQVKNQSF